MRATPRQLVLMMGVTASLLVAPLLQGDPDDAGSPRREVITSPLFSAGLQPVITGWEATPERLEAAYCQRCHTRAHAEWSEGLHRDAWRDPLFQVAFEHEPRVWCVHCHAPLQRQLDAFLGEAPEAEALLDEGVNCAACHVRDGEILGPRARPNDAHPVRATPELSSARFCAGCHQFNFPRFEGDAITYTSAPMQDTFHEWREAAPGVTCQGCHYEGHRLHGPHDAGWLREKFQDFHHSFSPETVLHVRFAVAPRGHRVPSGDLFHALAFEVALDPEFTRRVYQKLWARLYRVGPGDDALWNRDLLTNSGLSPAERAVSLAVDVPANEPLFARLVYRYHDPALGGAHPLPQAALQLVIWSSQLR